VLAVQVQDDVAPLLPVLLAMPLACLRTASINVPARQFPLHLAMARLGEVQGTSLLKQRGGLASLVRHQNPKGLGVPTHARSE